MNPAYKYPKTRGNDSRIHLTPGAAYALAATIMICSGSVHAATVNWKVGTVGNYNAGANWDTGAVPVAADTAKIDNSGNNPGGSTVNFLAGDNFTVAVLDVGASNINNNKPLFNHSGGTLSAGTLFLGHPGYGASKSPSYNLSGGVLNLSTALTFGSGHGTAINLSSTGVLNFTGGTTVIGASGGNHTLSLADTAAFNYNSNAQITIGGGDAASVGHVTLSGSSKFTANSVTTILLGNDATRGNTMDLSGSASFSAPLATMAMGQWNNGSNVTPIVPATTLTLANSSVLTVANLKLGGNNSGNPQYSIVYLDGGTIQAGSINSGSSTTAADATHNAIHCSGKIKAVTSAGNTNFFNGVWVDIGAGGLKFDTDVNDVIIPQVLHHDPTLSTADGGFEKLGDGTLTLSGFNTYTGPTFVSKGQLNLTSDWLPDNASVTVKDGAVLNLTHGLSDRVSSLTLGNSVKTSGVWGSSQSTAPNKDDVNLSGTGTIQVGASTYVPRQLIWNDAMGPFWDTDYTAAFVTSPTTGAQVFKTFDHVTFPDPATAGTTYVDIFGSVQPSSVTFTNTGANNYIVSGFQAGIGGSGGITKNGNGEVSLGGDQSTFTGPVKVIAGKVIVGASKAFGNSSGITISDGAQVDLNGSQPGAIYRYTVGGAGPLGAGIIVNGGASRFADGGIKDLVLTANTTLGNDGGRYDIGAGGVVSGNGFTLTKVGNNDMAFRGDASGSPVHIIVAAGSVWAETQSTAFGGSTGTLTVKSGARVGTYGALTVADTAVLIEGGGRIFNQGAGASNWTGPVTLAGAATVDSGGGDISLTGSVSGAASLTKAGGNVLTLSAPSYAGETIVSQGKLVLANVNSNNDAQGVRIETGAVLSLTHGQADTVKTLFLGGVQMVAGTYGATTNTAVAEAFRTALLDGTGTLVVTTSPGGSNDPYQTWADASITNPAYAALKGRDDDPDKDGLSNFKEYVFGSDPQISSGSPVRTSVAAGALTLTWNQRDTGPVYSLQQSATLAADSWSAVTDVAPVNAVDQTAVPAGCTRKQATMTLGAGRKFLRVTGSQD